MCLHGVYKWVNVINEQHNQRRVKVDACIADEIEELNAKGIVTLGCCCGHGRAGEVIEWENAYGKWKGYVEPPHALIKQESVDIARSLGYRPFPYYYADGKHHDVWQIHLKTGCLTSEELQEWNQINNLSLRKKL
jgi:hypothetical protein